MSGTSENLKNWLHYKHIHPQSEVYYNLEPAGLIELAIQNYEGLLAKNGALVCNTGKFTGRSPEDRFIVKDQFSHKTIWWSDMNLPISEDSFDLLYQDIIEYAEKSRLYIRDTYICTIPKYKMNIRVINDLAWHNLFCHNLFLRPSQKELDTFYPDFTLINMCQFEAEPKKHGTNHKNFVVINFSKKIILIGGTGYAGEMKKTIFYVLNYLLYTNHKVLPMHCAANINKNTPYDTALFFGLSSTGKTTLSNDQQRILIGDDEHGWNQETIFNFEGGCYAKTIHLDKKNEPQIFNAIKFGTIVENVDFFEKTRKINFDSSKYTQNTRAAYPVEYIRSYKDTINNSDKNYIVGKIPENIFFLSCDAHGVLPPVSKLNRVQAMYYFLTGYTARLAGTEIGVYKPKAVFSACFGLPFLPLHPIHYTNMFGEKIRDKNVNVWLINTGWIKGPYGKGNRIDIIYTRNIIQAILEKKLQTVRYQKDQIFQFQIPESCPKVPSEILNPINNWENPDQYIQRAQQLARDFIENFKQYEKLVDKDILTGAPVYVE